MLTFIDWKLLYLIYQFSCPFYSSAASCPLVMYGTSSEPTGTQWGFSTCEALWHWSRPGVRALLSGECSVLCSMAINRDLLFGEISFGCLFVYKIKLHGEPSKSEGKKTLLNFPDICQCSKLKNVFLVVLKTKVDRFLIGWISHSSFSTELYLF